MINRRLPGWVGMAAALLLWAMFPTATEAREIIFPPDGALLEESQLEVQGYRPKAAGTGALRVASSGPAIRKSIRPGRFAVTVKLSPGVNTITLGDEVVRVFHAPDGAPPEASAYVKPDLHTVDNGCDDCHVPEWDDPPLTEEGGALCLTCHDDVTQDGEGNALTSVHPPAEDDECTECHAFHAGNIADLPAKDVMEVCFGCHDPFGEEKGTTLHPPVEDGECLGCHDPHGSANSVLLIAPPGEICFECHDNPGVDDSGEEWSTPHPALDDGCTGCHSPHGSSHGSLLLAETASVCSECHDDKNADGDGNEWSTPHPPVEEGECVACHAPHGSAESALLVQAPPALCSECHEDMNVDGDGNEWSTPHPPVEEGECVACHAPHGSAESALLVQAPPALCSECHDDMNVDARGKAWSTPHPPVEEGDCTACHKPHGTTLPALLVGRAIELCIRCHTDAHEGHRELGESKKVTPPEGFPMTDEGRFLCIGCHLPHGSDQESLWFEEMSRFCTICHQM